MTGEVNDVMPGSDGLRIWVIFKKKQLVEIWTWTKRVDFWTCGRPVQLWTTGCLRVAGSDGTVSIVEIVSLSPCVEKPKSQEGNKSFVPELKKVVSVSRISEFLCIMKISHFRILSWSSLEYITVLAHLKIKLSTKYSRKNQIWTPSHGQARFGWPDRIYLKELCTDIGCSLEDLPGVMDDRNECWERVREIPACGWWWWYLLKRVQTND